jgi:hypothetical protein
MFRVPHPRRVFVFTARVGSGNWLTQYGLQTNEKFSFNLECVRDVPGLYPELVPPPPGVPTPLVRLF